MTEGVRRIGYRVLVGGAVLTAFAFTAAVLFAPFLIAALGIVASWGWVLLLFAIANFDSVEKWVGRGLSFAGWASGIVDRASTTAQVEGVINGGRRSLEDELPGMLAEPMRLRFVRSVGEVAQLEDGQVVVAMDKSRRAGANVARATLAYVGNAVIRPARTYVDTVALRSIDFSIAKRILSAQDRTALGYLVQQLWPAALASEADLRDVQHMVEAVEGEGLLTRILLSEYLELGRRLYGQFPPPGVHQETRDFLAHLHRIATRAPGQPLNLEFRRGFLRVGIVLVGERELSDRLGAAPYIRRCLEYARSGVGAVYLLGRGARNVVLQRAVEQLETDGRVLDATVMDYVVRRNGSNVAATCAKILFDSSAAAAVGLSTSAKSTWRRGHRRQLKGGARPR